jgi:hypothetical protein
VEVFYHIIPVLGTDTNPFENIFDALAEATTNGNIYSDCIININLMGASVHYIKTSDNSYS